MNQPATSNKRLKTSDESGLANRASSTIIAPSKMSVQKFEEAALSLPQPLHENLKTLFLKVFKELPVITQHQRLLAYLEDETKTPRSVQFKFRLTASSPVERTPAFRDLSQRADQIILICQEELRSVIIATKRLEIKNCRENFLQQIMICCRLFTMSHFLLAHNVKNVQDRIIRCVIAAIVSLREIKDELDMTEDQIQEKIYAFLPVPETAPRVTAADFFKTAIRTAAPPPPVLNSDRAFDSESTMDESGSTPSTPPIPPPQPIEDCFKILRILLENPIIAFRRGNDLQDRQTLVSSFLQAEITTNATSEVAQAIDGVEPIDKKTLELLIQSKVAKATKTLTQKVSSLTKQLRDSSIVKSTDLSKNNPKNSNQGGRQESARGNDHENREKVPASVNDAKNVKSTKVSAKKNKKLKGKKNDTKKGSVKK